VSDPVKIGGLTKTMVFDGDIFWDTNHENCDILRCHKKHGWEIPDKWRFRSLGASSNQPCGISNQPWN